MHSTEALSNSNELSTVAFLTAVAKPTRLCVPKIKTGQHMLSCKQSCCWLNASRNWWTDLQHTELDKVCAQGHVSNVRQTLHGQNCNKNEGKATRTPQRLAKVTAQSTWKWCDVQCKHVRSLRHKTPPKQKKPPEGLLSTKDLGKRR